MKSPSLTTKETRVFLKGLKMLKDALDLPSIASLAAFVGIKPRTVHSWLSGDARPTYASFNAVAETLVQRRDVLRRQSASLDAYFNLYSGTC